MTVSAPSDRTVVRKARILMLLEAAEHAGLTPMPVLELHAFAYFANVLSPVWELMPQERSVLRRRGGPYYPELQDDIDALVGRGLVSIEGLRHVEDEDGRWRLEGKFSIADNGAITIATALRAFQDEQRLFGFYRELAFALASIPDYQRADAVAEDATYGDERFGDGAIIDFAEWKQANYSENAARFFDRVMPEGRKATPAQKLHLYARHLQRRMASA
ncbi:hypothetical protein [Labrys wisconsinensis]|uniref:Uncharacterized protein n=1 Tax=Labrys wisconsinensis TaxID=425677 RepID=A0ABU0IYC5_9HYPH|nr:hypothetical protein [Labrys wisconsinensis]MDQ0467013.1 hypothetical protein [Labrys wisconsinensis]